MYNFEGSIINDRPGSMTSRVPDPVFVADIVTGLYKEACNLEKVYDLMMTEYSGENDFYALLSDLSDAMDNIDLDMLVDLRTAFGTGIIYSAAERWIIPPLSSLYDNTDANTLKDSIVTNIMDIIEECDYVAPDDMQIIAANLYGCIAAMFHEIYNTYEIGKWVAARYETLPVLNDVTRGFNEFMIRMNMSVDEVADNLYSKTQKFVFVSNEVDRDPEVSKKIRAMVPVNLKDEFEDVIELITEEQVESLLNGRLRITAEFLSSLANDEEDEE